MTARATAAHAGPIRRISVILIRVVFRTPSTRAVNVMKLSHVLLQVKIATKSLHTKLFKIQKFQKYCLKL